MLQKVEEIGRNILTIKGREMEKLYQDSETGCCPRFDPADLPHTISDYISVPKGTTNKIVMKVVLGTRFT